jgi:hypothetical protein
MELDYSSNRKRTTQRNENQYDNDSIRTFFNTENGFQTGLYLYELKFNYESSSSLKAEVSLFFMHRARHICMALMNDLHTNCKTKIDSETSWPISRICVRCPHFAHVILL